MKLQCRCIIANVSMQSLAYVAAIVVDFIAAGERRGPASSLRIRRNAPKRVIEEKEEAALPPVSHLTEASSAPFPKGTRVQAEHAPRCCFAQSHRQTPTAAPPYPREFPRPVRIGRLQSKRICAVTHSAKLNVYHMKSTCMQTVGYPNARSIGRAPRNQKPECAG